MTTVMVTGVLALAGFVQGLTGFGFGLIAMGLLTPLLGVDQALAVVTVASLATSIAMTGLTVRHVEWSSVGGLGLGSMAGVPLGYAVLAGLPQGLVVRALGLTICLLVAFEVAIGRRVARGSPRWAGWWFGLASGTLSGAFNVGGPPLVAFVYGRPWPKERQVATLSFIFLLSGLVRLGLMASGGQLPASSWAAAAWAVVPMLAAIACGNLALGRISKGQLRAGVLAALFLLGVRFLVVGS